MFAQSSLKTLIQALVIAGFAVTGSPALAASWSLDSERSHLAFGSIKKNAIGEVHTFEDISGTVSEGGKADIRINLASVQTYIDIRNERMIEHVFKGASEAILSAELDMAALEQMPVGSDEVMSIKGTLALLETDIPIEAEVFVMRLSESEVLVSTNDMIFVDLEAAGLNKGITKLMELAELPGITRTSPVTFRFVFTR